MRSTLSKLPLSTKLIMAQAIPLAVLLLLAGALVLVTRSVRDKVALTEQESSVFYTLAWKMKLEVTEVQRVAQHLVDVQSKVEAVESSLTAIGSKVQQVDETLSQISNATREQSEGVSQINVAVSQMDKVTQGNAAGAEESASAATELSAQAEALNQAVGELVTLVRGGSAVAERSGIPAAQGHDAKSTHPLVASMPKPAGKAAGVPMSKAPYASPAGALRGGASPQAPGIVNPGDFRDF